MRDKIVVVGNSHNGTDYDALVLRYDADGVADEAFGNAGVASFNLGEGDDWGEAVAIQRDQNMVAVGGIGSTAAEVLTMRIIGAPEGQFPGSVSGVVTMTQASGNKIPLSGITVRLINMDFEPDMVNYENNDAAFVAAAVTDKSGNYTIGSIGPGNYSSGLGA